MPTNVGWRRRAISSIKLYRLDGEAPWRPAAPIADGCRFVGMAQNKLTPLQQVEADRKAAAERKANKATRTFSDEEKATRKERVGKAKDALARSVGAKGDHVAAGRAALKQYLRQINEANQPDDQRFEMLIEAPFKAPPKKRDNNR